MNAKAIQIKESIIMTNANFAQIGLAYNVSREYVRQIANKLAIKGRKRNKEVTQQRKQNRKIAKGYCANTFVYVIRKHLRLINSCYCSQCYCAVLIDDMTKGLHLSRCKKCTATNARIAFKNKASNPGRN